MYFPQYPYINQNDLNLDWIIHHFKEFIESIDSLHDWQVQHEQEYLQLKQLYDQLAAGNFPPAVYDAIHLWVVQNTESIIGSAIKMVFFHLDNSGYFIAEIPDSWSEIVFNTSGLDIFPAGVDYGHLVLSY